MYEILSKCSLTPVVDLFEVHAPEIARKAQAGQFVILRVDERGGPAPITVADYDREEGTVIIVAQHLGKSTMQMGTLKPSEAFAGLTGPLGWPIKNRRYGTVVCVAEDI